MLQSLVNGFTTGVLYSLFAIGFALVYNTAKLFHVAAAALYVFAAYMFYLFAVTLGVPMVLSAAISLVLTMGLSLLTDVGVYRPLRSRKASNNVAMIASIGLMTVIVNVLAMCFDNDTKVVYSTIHRTFPLGKAILTMSQMWQLVVGGIAIAAFLIFIGLSRWGLRFRAMSSDGMLYETLGYNMASTRTVVFLLSGFFIALASCLAVYGTGLNPHIGMDALINALVAMIIGGVGRFGTCVIGGLSLGLLQALTVHYISSNWEDAVVFVLLLLLLFIRPQGIAGYRQRTV